MSKRYVTYKGKTQTLTEWSKELGITTNCIDSRLNKLGWSIEKTLGTPTKPAEPFVIGHNGKNQTSAQWAVELGIKQKTIEQRLNYYGWSIERALTQIPDRQFKRSLNFQCELITFEGKTQTLTKWAREKGISVQTLFNRLRYYGWSVERALTTPARKRS